MFYTILIYATAVANFIGMTTEPNYYAYSTIVPNGSIDQFLGGDLKSAFGNVTIMQKKGEHAVIKI